MPVNVHVTVVGAEQLARMLREVSPKQRPRILRDGLLAIAFEIQKDSTQNQIIRGGGRKAPVDPVRITNRTGFGRRSIRVNRAPLPNAVEVGSDVAYMAEHETGAKHLPARPWLQPAVDTIKPQMSALFISAWEKVLSNV